MWEKLERKDFEKAKEYLQKHSPFTCPIYGNVASAGFLYKAFAMRSGDFFVYKEFGEVLGIIAGFNDGNVMVHTLSPNANLGVLDIVIKFSFHSLWGLSGNLPEKHKVSEAVKIEFDSRRLDIMVLNKPNGESEDGACVDCSLIRIDRRFLSSSYISFIKKCLWEGFGFKSNSYDLRKRIKERTQLEPYWFLSKGKEFVAQAHVHAMTASHGYIGGVCTPREQRRKGYAKEIVKRVCEYIYEQGRIPALAVSAANKAAYSLYEKLGFEKIGSTIVYMQEREFKGDENEN